LVNHAVVMEDYRQGERIRRYVLEGFDGRQWSKLCEGAHVGRKRIDCFDEAAVSTLRLRVTESAGQPLIRSFQAFQVDNFRLAAGQPLRSPWKQCGAWRAADFQDRKAVLKIDLTPAITEAGQWELVFRPSAGDVALNGAELTEEGVRSPAGMIARVPGRPLALHVTRAATVTKDADIRLGATLEGQPADGVIQIRAVPH
jgi:alpha-L-fucosidase